MRNWQSADGISTDLFNLDEINIIKNSTRVIMTLVLFYLALFLAFFNQLSVGCVLQQLFDGTFKKNDKDNIRPQAFRTDKMIEEKTKRDFEEIIEHLIPDICFAELFDHICAV